MKIAPRRLILPLCALAILAGAVVALRPEPLAVDIGRTTHGPLRVTIDAEGKTRLRQRFVVSAPVAGRLARLQLKEGDMVERGTVIARIDPFPMDTAIREAQARLAEWQAQRAGVATLRPKHDALLQARARIAAAEATRHSAEARVEQARAALEQAQRERQRAERLEARGTISREASETAQLQETTRAKEYEASLRMAQGAVADIKAAQATLAVLEAEQRDPDYLLSVYNARIASVEAELARLRDEAARTDIIAPESGIVLRVLQENERVVAPGTPLLELGNLAGLELIVDVLSADAVRIQPGMAMLVEHWGGGHTLQARVRLIEPAAFTKISALGVEEQRVNVIGDFVDSPQSLGDGYRVEARIIIWEQEYVLRLPLSALFRCADTWCTFVMEAARAQQRQIKIGQRNDTAVEIRQGLVAGEQVILHPSDQVHDGKPVKVRGE